MERLQWFAEQHSCQTDMRDGALFVSVPWSMRLVDGELVTGLDWERVTDMVSLQRVLGY